MWGGGGAEEGCGDVCVSKSRWDVILLGGGYSDF